MIVPSPLALRIGAGLVGLSLAGTLVPAVGWACVGGLLVLALSVWAEGRSLTPGCVLWERKIPKRLSLGEPEPLVDRFESRAAFALLVELRDSLPPDLTFTPDPRPSLRLEAYATRDVPFEAVGLRRGERRLPPPMLRVGRLGGLALRQWAATNGSVLRVTPNVARLRRYEVLRQSRALGGYGIHSVRRTGLGVEFDHLRAYSQGDDLRRVHWKATARRGFPVSQVVRVERDQSILIAVDVSHWMGISAGSLSRLDYAVDAALFLAHVARRSGDRVGLALFAHDLITLTPPSAQPGQEQRLLEVLSTAEPQPVHVSYRNLARGLLGRRLRRSLVVVLSEPIDEESGNELQRALMALRSRHVPLAVSLQDPELQRSAQEAPATAFELCRRLAVGEVRDARAERLRRLQGRGVGTLDVLPENLSVAVVNRYLEIKSRRAL